MQQSQQTAASSQVTQNLSSTFNAKVIKRKRCRSKINSGGKGCKHLHNTQSDDINDACDAVEDDQEQEIYEQEQNKYDDKMNKKQDRKDSPFFDVNENDQRIKSNKDHLNQF
ncbi:MAG: hypothetical protein EZS28_022875 [Streblomastix strix]|uniref:Uncharacterized protein n=1 Tax=Streblomastix strix TaxID=222440 RepID=A0A5J4VG79_9EUKA|nr:MAG: hypothetical protein EZS28_022875 [Streblomastix strix]